MGHTSSGLVFKPVSIYDVQKALGVSECDLGSLCTHPKLNMWAKYKPIDAPVLTTITYSQRQVRNFGIGNIPDWSRMDRMLSFLFGTRSTENAPNVGLLPIYWIYNMPKGGAASPYRLTDFVLATADGVGYLHSAERPFTGIQSHEFSYESSGYMRIDYGMGAQSVMTIKLNELTYQQQFTWGQMYFGVAFCRLDVTPNVVYVTTQYETSSEGTTDINMNQTVEQGFYVNIYNNSLPSGTYLTYPIVSDTPIHFETGSGIPGAAHCICLLDPIDGGDTIAIETPIFRLDIIWFALYRKENDIRFIYGNVVIGNPNAVQSNFTLLLQVFNNENGGELIAQKTILPGSGVDAGGSVNIDLTTIWQQSSAGFDILNDGNILHAYSARITVTPTGTITNPQPTTEQALVSDGMPR